MTYQTTATSDIGAMLFVKPETGEKYVYLVPVKTIPATGAAPGQIDVTELDSRTKQSIPDRVQLPAYDFTYNYTKENFLRVSQVYDGAASVEALIVYGDKSGFHFVGRGATWTDALSVGSAVGAMLSVAADSAAFIEDVSSLVDASTIPSQKYNPFGENIQISPIGNMSVAVGQSQSFAVLTSPSDAAIGVLSQNLDVLTTSVSGKEVTLTGVAAGTAEVEVTAGKADMTGAKKSFTVTVTAAV